MPIDRSTREASNSDSNSNSSTTEIDPLEFEEYFTQAFKRPIIPCITREPLTRAELSETETIQYAQFKNERRKESWLRGRRALKILLRDLEFAEHRGELRDTDTSATFFPHPAFSLSHSQDLAIAIACLAPAFGVGIDLEFIRPTKPQMARFYLSESEREWLDELDSEERSLQQIRLWTVKEALFKSDLNNLGRTLLRYELEDPISIAGRASIKESAAKNSETRKQTFDYKSKRFGSIWVTVAISYGEQNTLETDQLDPEPPEAQNGETENA